MCADNADWLEDFVLFMALKDAHNGSPWIQWEMPLRSTPATGDRRWRATRTRPPCTTTGSTNGFSTANGWRSRAYANSQGIQIVGDIPIFVAMDCSDAWTNPKEFFLDDQYHPTVVAGVPPDYFSETGQLWGNPLYNWKAMKENGYAWWLRRMRAALRLYDIVRVDHFRGFAGYWEVPAGEETAVKGTVAEGTGSGLFQRRAQGVGREPAHHRRGPGRDHAGRGRAAQPALGCRG